MNSTATAPVVAPATNGKALTGWDLIQSPLPPDALRPIHQSVYGTAGLTDINDAYVIERLHQARRSGLSVELGNPDFNTVGKETVTFKRGAPDEYEQSEWVVECTWPITVDGLVSVGVGAHQDKRLDVARKGAKTSAFKDAIKYLGIGLEVRKGQPSEDQLRSSAGNGSRGGFDSKAATDRARAAIKEMGREWGQCKEHGDTLVVKEKDGKYRITCTKKSGDQFCKTVFWEKQIPPPVLAAIRNEPSAEAEFDSDQIPVGDSYFDAADNGELPGVGA